MNKKPATIISLSATVITIIIGVIVILGWVTHNDLLASIVPGELRMKFNTAVCFVLSSVALLPYLFPQKNEIWRKVAVFLSVAVCLIGLATLLQYIFQTNF